MALYEAANIMLTRFPRFQQPQGSGLKIPKKRGHQRARVAVARMPALIMHVMRQDHTEFHFKEADVPTDRTVKGSLKLIGTSV